MNDIIVMETGIKFGAAVTLSTVEEYIQCILSDSSKGTEINLIPNHLASEIHSK